MAREQVDELKRWPYSIHGINETLDPSLIEAKGRQILYQGLSQGKVVAFVGSGVPMAYGRLSWQQWQDLQLGQIDRNAESFLACADKLQSWLSSYKHLLGLINKTSLASAKDRETLQARRSTIDHKLSELKNRVTQVKTLRASFQQVKENKTEQVGGDLPPIRFQIAEALHDLLRDSWPTVLEPISEQTFLAKALEKYFTRSKAQSSGNAPADALTSEHILSVYADSNTDSALKKNIEDSSTEPSTLANLATGNTEGNLDTDVPPELKIALTSLHNDARNYSLELHEHARRATHPSAREDFQTVVKCLLSDEISHAEELLRDALRYRSEYGRDNTLTTDLQKRCEAELYSRVQTYDTTPLKLGAMSLRDGGMSSKRYSVLGHFKTRQVIELAEHYRDKPDYFTSETAETWNTVFELVIDSITNENLVNSGPSRTFISPTHRFVVAMMMALDPDPLENLARDEANGTSLDSDSPLRFHKRVQPSDYESRLSMIDRHLDPLWAMALPLGIRRFLTFNYDFEIERLLEDREYRRARDSNRLRSDGMGGRVSDHSFDRERADDLFGFALDVDDVDASVYHLHGRATRHERLVVTERDYQELYIRNDNHRETVDEAIRTAFAADPIMLVGLGMTEADVLHTLRQFMSDDTKARERRASALMPATASRRARAQSAATMLLRYGVHVIHYGDARLRATDANKTTWTVTDFDWLHHISELIWLLDQRIKKRMTLLGKLVEWWTAGNGKDKPEDIIYAQKHVNDPECNPFFDIATKNALRTISKHLGATEVTLQRRSTRSIETDIRTASALGLLFGKITSLEEFSLDELPEHLSPVTFLGDESQWEIDSRPENPRQAQFLLFERSILSNLVAMENAAMPSGADIRKIIRASQKTGLRCYFAQTRTLLRAYHARRVALNGVKNTLMTAALTEAIRLLHEDWGRWQLRWTLSPPHRVARYQISNIKDGGDIPALFSRHKVEPQRVAAQTSCATSEKQWLEPPERTKPSMPTSVRSFDTFLHALQNRTKQDTSSQKLRDGRRYHLVCAQRGLGKGSFVAAFSSPQGLSQYITSSWPTQSDVSTRTGRLGRRDYAAAVLTNLSFSTEIASSIDSTIDVFRRTCSHMESLLVAAHHYASILENYTAYLRARVARPTTDSADVQTKRAFAVVSQRIQRLPRIEKLRYLLTQFESLSYQVSALNGRHPIRLLLVIHAAELLFAKRHEGGKPYPKNREIAQFLSVIIGVKTQSVPFDLVVIGDDRGLGSPLVRRRSDVDTTSQTNNLLHVPMIRSDIPLTGIAEIQRRVENSAIDFVEHPIALEHHERTGLLYGFEEEAHGTADIILPGEATTEQSCNVYFARPMSASNFVVVAYRALATLLYLDHALKTDFPNKDESIAQEAILRSTTKGIFIRKKFSDLSIDQLLEEDMTTPVWNSSFIQQINVDDSVLRTRYIRDTSAAREWRSIRRMLRSSRFCLTLLLAAAEHVAFSTLRPDNDIDTRTWIGQASRAAADLIRRTSDAVGVSSKDAREDVVLSIVLDTYEAYQQVGEPAYDMALHHLLLRHLAVVGTPLSLDVLVRAPEIRDYLDSTFAYESRPRTRVLAEAIAALVVRGLVFRISPHPRLITLERQLGDDNAKHSEHFASRSPSKEYRFALHRMVQLHMLRKIGADPDEYGALNSFAPSLYASMPSKLPNLTFDAYHFHRSLVTSLSQYPDLPLNQRESHSSAFLMAGTATKVQCLRAALSVMRSTFSIGVISRLASEGPAIEDTFHAANMGLFEQHRVQLRWIIRKAWELLAEGSNQPINMRDYQPDARFDQLSACYRDEIVWLYNECGVICLSQGILKDAASLLRQALSLNRLIERSEEGGAMQNRIQLNLAVVQIERGRLRSAMNRLTQIVSSERDQGSLADQHLVSIAIGYKGVIEALYGRFQSADRLLAEALEGLEAFEDGRAPAIFYRHRGDVARRQLNTEDARRYLSAALNHARSGGHQDLVNRITVAAVKNEALSDTASHDSAYAPPLERLDQCEAYATLMEMPSLTVDVLLTRAAILLKQGEASRSGALAAKAAAIAKGSDMTLRLNAALNIHADVLQQRNETEAAQRQLKRSMGLARKCGNVIAIGDAEGLLSRMRHNSL